MGGEPGNVKSPRPGVSAAWLAMAHYIRSRPILFWINIGMVAAWLYLLWPLLSPVFLTPIYVVYVATLMLPAIGYAYLAFVGGARINTIVLVGLIVVFAIGETYARIEFPLPQNAASDSYVFDRQYPYYMFTGGSGSKHQMPSMQGGQTDADRTYTLNADGFRIERPLNKDKPERELRIFVTGGSTVVYGAPLSNTISRLIESNLIRRGFGEARAYDFGIVSAVSGQELALLTDKLVDYSPDIVISYGGGNNIHSPYQYDPRPGFPYNFIRLQLASQLLEQGLDFRSALASQVFKSRLISHILAPRAQEIHVPLAAARKLAGYRTAEWEAKIIADYRDDLHRMCRIAHAFNFRFYAVLQPLIFQKAHLGTAESRLVFGDANFAPFMRREYDRAVQVFRQLQADDGADGKCRFVDLSEIFRNDTRDLFWDFIHITNAGNRTVAAAIADDLAASFLSAPSH